MYPPTDATSRLRRGGDGARGWKAEKPPPRPPAVADPTPADAGPADGDTVKPAPTLDPAKPVAPRLKPADQPVKRSGQVAVFVSRKEMKIFVRQGREPLFDMPLAIGEPDKPLANPC